MINPYTSKFIRLSHLNQKFFVHFIVIMNDGGMVWVEAVDSYQGKGGGTEGGYYLIVFFCFFYLFIYSFCAFVFRSLMSCLFFK